MEAAASSQVRVGGVCDAKVAETEELMAEPIRSQQSEMNVETFETMQKLELLLDVPSHRLHPLGLLQTLLRRKPNSVSLPRSLPEL